MKTILRSENKIVTIDTDGSFIIIGEKINPCPGYLSHPPGFTSIKAVVLEVETLPSNELDG